MRSHIYRSLSAKWAWVPCTGVVLAGVLAFGLSLEGATVPSRANENNRAINRSSDDVAATKAATSRVRHTASTKAARTSFKVGTMPQREYPIGPVYQIDPFNDIGSRGRREGKWVGAMPAPRGSFGGAIATHGGGSCSFAIDCDDGDDCTTDICDIAAGGGEGSGTCVNTPVANGQPGTCDDGVFCNGEETCQGGADVFLCEGTCAGGPSVGQTCQTSATNVGCPDSFCATLTCSGGPSNGNACEHTQECSAGGGTCDPAPPSPCGGGDFCNEFSGTCGATCGADDSAPGNPCDDALKCNGLEVCASGICVPGLNPCGASADCVEMKCAPCGPGCTGAPCSTDDDCNGSPGACQPTVLPSDCFFGRCCGTGTCQKLSDANCAAGEWYAGDTGRIGNTAACPDCPVYGAGIGSQGTFTVTAGPASLSPSNNIMSGAPLRKLGDDYNFCASGDFLSLNFMRFVGGVEEIGNSRIAFEFYDINGVFIEDLFFISNTFPSIITVQRLDFLTPIVIPCEGFVVAHVLQAFAGNIVDVGQMLWVATDGVDEGSNDAGMLYVETDLDWSPASPPAAVANFLKVCSGGLNAGAPCGVGGDCDSSICDARSTDVLAFELEGNIVTAPVGACCSDGVIGCDELTRWDCENASGVFLGLGGQCASCSIDSPDVGSPCRTCDGGANAGLACGNDADCPGGGFTCVLDDSVCRLCDNSGDPCIDSSTCGGGNCVGTCEVAQLCTGGACCVTATGECVEGVDAATCAGMTGTFQGLGSDCNPNACVQPVAFASGRDNCEDAALASNIIFVPCASDSDCGNNAGSGKCDVATGSCVVTVTGNNSGASSTPRLCLGGTNAGALCTADGDCPGSTCADHVCVGGANDGLTCDNANDCPGAGAFCAGNPDSCNPPSPTPGGELGWWESFSIDACAFVRVDHCATQPVKIPAYRVLYDSCPCGSTIFTKRDPNVPAEPPDSRGAPYCDLNNAWQKFGPLGAGKYYYPILSFLGGNFEDYQFHITTTPCPNAVCCHNTCSDSSNTVCTDDSSCAAGEKCVVQDGGASPSLCKDICNLDGDCTAGTCEPSCSLMNVLECQGIGGAFLAPPNRSSAVVVCGTVCDTGSCCTGPGTCEDEILGVAITKGTCTSDFSGKYVGGFRCFGGSCVGGSRIGLSCSADSQCPSSVCGGDESDIAQPSPCPVCEIAAGDNCQFFDDSVGSRPSDLTLAGGSRTADDFIPAGTEITTVCVWGNYTEADEDGNGVDCSDNVADNFSVIIMNPDADGVPNRGDIVGQSDVSPGNVARAVQPASALEDVGQIFVYAYQLTLDTPITLPAPDVIYWIEVQNDTTQPAGNNCLWSWQTVDLVYNDYSGAGANSGYAGLRTTDFAFCLNTNFSAPEPYLRQCCDCGEACTLKTKRDCDNELSSFDVANDNCAVCSPLPVLEDNCNAIIGGAGIVADETVNFDNHCTSTDGPNPTPTELSGGETAVNDLWYKYTADCDGTVTFSTCPTGNASGGGIDTLIAVYRGCNTCPDQIDHISRLFPAGTALDENCNGQLDGGGAFATGTASVGDCFLVRIAGFGGQGSEQGQGTATFECAGGPSLFAPTVCNNTDLKSRYICVVPTNGTGDTSIRVEVKSNPLAPGTVGQFWFAQAEGTIANAPNPSLPGALLGCNTPVGQTWTAGDVHLFGSAIVPGAQYGVRMCDPTGTDCSDEFLVDTGLWGDVVADFGGGGQPDFVDIGAVVDKFVTSASAPDMVSADLRGIGNPGDPNFVDAGIDFTDIAADVDAFSGIAFPFATGTCP